MIIKKTDIQSGFFRISLLGITPDVLMLKLIVVLGLELPVLYVFKTDP